MMSSSSKRTRTAGRPCGEGPSHFRSCIPKKRKAGNDGPDRARSGGSPEDPFLSSSGGAGIRSAVRQARELRGRAIPRALLASGQQERRNALLGRALHREQEQAMVTTCPAPYDHGDERAGIKKVPAHVVEPWLGC